jgi:hypothetical protein
MNNCLEKNFMQQLHILIFQPKELHLDDLSLSVQVLSPQKRERVYTAHSLFLIEVS